MAAQFTASAAEHVLPGGLGAGAVNLRFLIRCGTPLGGVASAVAVKGTAGAIAHGALVALLVVACPGVLYLPHLSAGFLAAVCAVTAAAVVVLADPAVGALPAGSGGGAGPPRGRPGSGCSGCSYGAGTRAPNGVSAQSRSGRSPVVGRLEEGECHGEQ